jgi:tight adherence protein B
VLWALRDRQLEQVEAALPAVLESTARSLRSGASLAQALDEAGRRAPEPMRAELERIVDQTRDGAVLEQLLVRWSDQRPLPSFRLAGAALVLAAQLGGPASRAVDRVAGSLRQRRAVQRELRALATQARLSALVIAVAPCAFGLVGAMVDPRLGGFLFTTPSGLACLMAGAALDAGAAIWMARVVQGVQA